MLPVYTVRSRHSGAEFEGQLTNRDRNQPVAGVTPVPAGPDPAEERQAFGGAAGTGLNPFARGTESPKLPSRKGDAWRCVEILAETSNPQVPKVKCKFCDWTRQAGATLICEHVLCLGGATNRCMAKRNRNR
jgi:hypothetical protein